MKSIHQPGWLLLLLLISCSKHNDSDQGTQNDFDVYITGSYYIQDTPGQTIAYWKNNDAPTILHTPKVIEGSGISDLEVLNGDILISGWIQYAAYLWKNGERTRFPDGSQLRDLATAGNDIYIAGEITDGTKSRMGYWKNGAFVELTEYSGYQGENGYCTAIAAG